MCAAHSLQSAASRFQRDRVSCVDYVCSLITNYYKVFRHSRYILRRFTWGTHARTHANIFTCTHTHTHARSYICAHRHFWVEPRLTSSAALMARAAPPRRKGYAPVETCCLLDLPFLAVVPFWVCQEDLCVCVFFSVARENSCEVRSSECASNIIRMGWAARISKNSHTLHVLGKHTLAQPL